MSIFSSYSVEVNISHSASPTGSYTSYWIGLSSDEIGDTALAYPDWEPFNAAEHTRFASTPAMPGPACTVVRADDGFSAWQESSCEESSHILCQYHGTTRNGSYTLEGMF